MAHKLRKPALSGTGSLGSSNSGEAFDSSEYSETARHSQVPRSTVEQAAALANVSVRSVYKAKRIIELRPDLGDKCMLGTMSLDAAYRIATMKMKPTSWDRLVRAWNAATDDDRGRFVAIINEPANLQSRGVA